MCIQKELSRYQQGTFADLIYTNALLYPEAQAFVRRRCRITFSEYNRRVNRLVHGLQSVGASRGNMVGIVSWNSQEVVDALGAAMKGGLVAAPLNAGLQPDELEQVIRDSGASMLLMGPDCAEAVSAIRP